MVFTAYFLNFVFLDCTVLHVFTDIERMLVIVPDVFKKDIMSYFITKKVGGRKRFFLQNGLLNCFYRNAVYSYCSVYRYGLCFAGSCLPNLYFAKSWHLFICTSLMYFWLDMLRAADES